MKSATRVCLALAITVALTCVWGAAAPRPAAANGAIAPVPFGPGEKLDYRVTVGILGGAGRGSMEVAGIDTIHGNPCYQLRFDLKGGLLFAKVDDRLQSWLDVSTLTSRRFEQHQREVNYKRDSVTEFFPGERRWVRVDREESGDLPTNMPLDDVSFLYFVRTLPLEVGETYTFDRYYKEGGNPVILKVLRREKITVPFGKFQTIVVQPIIRAGGLFGEGGEAEVFLSDDDRRLLVQIRSKVPVLGHMNILLDSYTPGSPIDGAAGSFVTESGSPDSAWPRSRPDDLQEHE